MVRSGRASIPPFTPGTIALVACATPALPWSPVVPQQLEAKFCRSPGHWSCHCHLVDVPPIALTLLAVHGCPMAGYTVCSSVLTEVACDKVVFQEICLTNEVARYREVTLLGKVPIFGKVVSAVAFMVNLLPAANLPPCTRVAYLAFLKFFSRKNEFFDSSCFTLNCNFMRILPFLKLLMVKFWIFLDMATLPRVVV